MSDKRDNIKKVKEGFISGPKGLFSYENTEEGAKENEEDNASLKDKITRSIVRMMKKKGPPPSPER